MQSPEKSSFPVGHEIQPLALQEAQFVQLKQYLP